MVDYVLIGMVIALFICGLYGQWCVAFIIVIAYLVSMFVFKDGYTNYNNYNKKKVKAYANYLL